MISRLQGKAAACFLLILPWVSEPNASGAQASSHQEMPATPLPGFIEFENVRIPMRDGVILRADVYVPPGSGRWPAILIRTPYNRHSDTTRGYRVFTEHGYAVVTEDVRGRNGSDGTFGSIEQEGPDGNDTINWIAAQPWSNGRVGMAGASYVGIVQWRAAVQHNPHLLAIFPLVSGDDEYMDRYYSPGGALQLAHRLVWLSENLTPRGLPRPPFAVYIRHLPLGTSDVAATTLKLEMWRVPLNHPSYDRFWLALSVRNQLPEVTAAVSSMGGWFDDYVESDLDAFSHLAKRGMPIETWIGPWSHTLTRKYSTVDFGPMAMPHVRALQLAWFDRFLKVPVSASSQAPLPLLHIFVMGSNVWRDEHEWPLARTRYTPFYLESGGRANTASGDGELTSRFRSGEPPDRFIYDPSNPVPTTGGAVCCNPRLLPAGPLDQSAVERRNDVLVYTSPPLRDDLEVTGPVGVTIYVATSASDTDFTAKLVDVFPDGRPLLVTDGIARLRYRVSLARPVFVKRNVPYQIHIDAGVTSWVFAEGHRIRLEISSSNFPRYDRNLNSSRPNASESKITVAMQTVMHDQRYPSVVVLPVIPRVRTSTSALDSHSRVPRTAIGAH
ncbi:MAG: CocE/NonD family hydrolase [Bryobacteraceae bacterium]